jgi:ATP-dependent DNA helicase RecG
MNIIQLFDKLLSLPNETEWLEFKKNNSDPKLMGKNISALANSACLQNKPKGYLVFGIEDHSHHVTGTTFDPYSQKVENQNLLFWLTQGLNPKIGFQPHLLDYQGKRIVLFEINRAVNQPVTFLGKAYIRIGSSTTDITNHPDKARAIWNCRMPDWSAEICPRATLDDLDPEALQKARKEYLIKFPAKAAEVETWTDCQFLNKARITIQNQITHAAILLLGKPESAGFLAPAVAKISWILKDTQNQEKDYEHFAPPFLINVDRVFNKIRNLTLRIMPGGKLFPIEISQYDHWVFREALHNCIAHQDYPLHGRIIVMETPDSVTLTNCGGFLPGSIENVIRQDAPQEIYRNPFLADAMVNLNMIDTQGGGIKKMFLSQRNRLFPLPDYDLSKPDGVAVRIRGQIIDEKYSQLLTERADLDLWTVILLDKVQKNISVSKEDHLFLKRLKVVEGRYPRLFISAPVAAVVDQKAEHILNRGLDRQYYLDLICELIHKHQPVTRRDIDRLLVNKLPGILTEEQKSIRIHNLLYTLKKMGKIKNEGSKHSPKWVLHLD